MCISIQIPSTKLVRQQRHTSVLESSSACDAHRALRGAALPPTGMSITLTIWCCIGASLAIVAIGPAMVRTVRIRDIVLGLWRGRIIAVDIMGGV